jgi:predicted amidophosphoribosyltransferase
MLLPFFISIKGIVQELIHKLKYKGHEDIGALGNWYAADLKEMTILRTANMLIPVPLHKKNLEKEGIIR